MAIRLQMADKKRDEIKQDFNESEKVFVQKAERYCVADEQCIASVRAKLMMWGVPRDLSERIMHHLVRNDFINERRFAVGYCQSKLRNAHWGRNKITFQLRSKQLSKADIDAALASIDPEEYTAVLDRLLVRRWANTQQEALSAKRPKVVSYLQGRGFGLDEALDAVARFVDTNHEIKEQ